MGEVKQILSPEKYAENNQYDLEEHDEGGYLGINTTQFAKHLRTYAKEVVKYTLEQAAEKGKVVMTENCNDHTPYRGPCVSCGRYDNPEIPTDMIDQQSILSLEEQIIKDLKL
jgi:hypothetical protein